MCDTYEARCAEPGCDKTMPYHLPDFAVPRSAVHVRCRKHKPPQECGWWRVTITGSARHPRVPRDLRFFVPYYLCVIGVPDPLAAGHGVNEGLDETGVKW
jgi:hypothetical protein